VVARKILELGVREGVDPASAKILPLRAEAVQRAKGRVAVVDRAPAREFEDLALEPAPAIELGKRRQRRGHDRRQPGA